MSQQTTNHEPTMNIKTTLLGLTASLFLSSAAFGQAPDSDAARPMNRGAFGGDRIERGLFDQGSRQKMRGQRGQRQGFERPSQRGMRGQHMNEGGQQMRGQRGQRQGFERPSQRGMRGQHMNEGGQQMRGQRGQRGMRQGLERPSQGAERFGPKAGANQGGDLRSKLDKLKAERHALQDRIAELKERKGNAESDKPLKPRKKGKRKGGKRKKGGEGPSKKQKKGGGPFGG